VSGSPTGIEARDQGRKQPIAAIPYRAVGHLPRCGASPNARGGLEMLSTFHAKGITLPVIFYVGEPEPDRHPSGRVRYHPLPDVLLTLVGEALGGCGRTKMVSLNARPPP
jgi:hypothetical protein